MEIIYKNNTAMDQFYSFCEVDSTIMGINVAKILPAQIPPHTLQKLLRYLREREFKLVYWATNEHTAYDFDAIDYISQGYCCAQNITYNIDNGIYFQYATDMISGIEEFKGERSNGDLDKLAIECCKFSHLNTDPVIPKEHVMQLYLEWIRNSISGTLADGIFTAVLHERIIGMVTYTCDPPIGRIGLIAVNRDERRRGWGRKLLRKVNEVLINNKCSYVEVVTQYDNIPAKGLYEKFGFSSTDHNRIYHLWLYS